MKKSIIYGGSAVGVVSVGLVIIYLLGAFFNNSSTGEDVVNKQSQEQIVEGVKTEITDIFVVAMDGSELVKTVNEEFIGCNDKLIAVTVDSKLTPQRAVEKLLAYNIDARNVDNEGLYNVFQNSDKLKIESIIVDVDSGVATVKLSEGLLVGGMCDNPRVTAQLNATLLQFNEIETVEVFIGDIGIGEYLSEKDEDDMDVRAIVYKTKKNYNGLVSIELDKNKNKIVHYPRAGEVSYNGILAVPTELEHGYTLDEEDLSPDSAFLKLTYRDYEKFEETPTVVFLQENILERSPFLEMYDCTGVVDSKIDLIEGLNGLIRNSELSKCKTLINSNKTIGKSVLISPRDFKEKMETGGYVLVDIRTAEEDSEEKISGTKIVLDFYKDDFAEQVNKLDKNKKYLYYCRTGNRSGSASVLAEKFNFTEAYELEGGIVTWKKEGYQVD